MVSLFYTHYGVQLTFSNPNPNPKDTFKKLVFASLKTIKHPPRGIVSTYEGWNRPSYVASSAVQP